MRQPIHTLGPIKWSEDFGLYSDHGTITNAYNGAQYDDSSDPATIDISKPDARLLVSAYNAFDSAGRELGLNAVELAERLADGGIAGLVIALRNYVEQRGHLEDAKAWAENMLAKVNGTPK